MQNIQTGLSAIYVTEWLARNLFPFPFCAGEHSPSQQWRNFVYHQLKGIKMKLKINSSGIMQKCGHAKSIKRVHYVVK